MIVSGGTTPNAWTVSSLERTNKSGQVLKRYVVVKVNQEPLDSKGALRLASAIRLVAKNGATQ